MRWLFSCLLFLALIGANSAGARDLALSYRIYFGGLKVAEFRSEITLGASDYRIVTKAHSTGILDYFYPIEVTSEGLGTVADGRIEAELFRSDGYFDGERRRTELRSRPGQAPDVTLIPPRDPAKRDAVPEQLQVGTVDPYAAALSLALSAGAMPCDGKLQVFNGKTRTDFSLLPAGSETLQKTEYSAFSGPAKRCELRYETLAGGYKKSWFAKDDPGLKTWLWVARLGGDGPWIPVRLLSEGRFGSVVGHIIDASERIDLAEHDLLHP